VDCMDSEEMFEEIKRMLRRKGWKEQKCGEVYINGTIGTNFWKKDETIHISLDLWEDEEALEAMKE